MQNDKIKVSVLIPIYNQEELVVKAIQSIPSRSNIELVLCDDGSTDNSFEAACNCANESGINTIALTNRENMGVAYTMNRLYDTASGEYVVALGSDDYFTPDFELALDELDGTDMVYFNLEINDGSLFELTPETKEGYCGSTKFIRREFLGDTRCPDKKAAEDYDFYQELLKKNPTEKFTGLTVKHYNYPREGSLYWQLKHGLIEDKEEVNHPSHYKIEGRKECFDEMIEKFTTEEVIAFCKLNAYKYRYRAGLKGDEKTDLKKAEWYENKAKELSRKKLDSKSQEFMKFFSQHGVKFVDIDTGEEIRPEEGGDKNDNNYE